MYIHTCMYEKVDLDLTMSTAENIQPILCMHMYTMDM